MREAADVPVAVGFGVGTPEQVAQVGEIADGVIIGSRLVRGDRGRRPRLEAGLDDIRSFLRDSVRALAPGTDRRLPTANATAMWVFLGFTFGMCLFVVLWATGLAQDAAGVVALGILGIGVLAQMASALRREDLASARRGCGPSLIAAVVLAGAVGLAACGGRRAARARRST